MAEDRTIYKLDGDASGLVRSLQSADRALEKTSKQVNKTEKEIKDLGDQSAKSALVSKRFVTAMNRVGDSLKKTTKSAGKFASNLNKKVVEAVKKADLSLNKLAKGSGELAAALLGAGAAAGVFLQNMADAQNELSDLSVKTGVSTKTLAGLRLAAKGSGQELADLASALEPMIERMGQVAIGSQGAKDAFATVGVEVLDAEGKLKSADAVILEITENLSNMEDPTERAAAAALAFGGAGTKLIQALGGQDLGVFADAAERFGMDTGPRAAAAADQWQRAMANLDLVMRPFNTQVLEFGTKLVENFSLGWVYLSTLLEELSKNIIPNFFTLWTLGFADIAVKATNFAETLVDTFVEALKGYAKAYAFFTGDLGPLNTVKEIGAGIKENIQYMQNYWEETLIAAGTTSELAGAYQKAFREAKAFFDLQNAPAASQTGAPMGLIVPPEEEKEKKEKKEEKEKEEKEEEVTTLGQMVALTDELIENMSDLADPSGIFRDILGEISDTMAKIDEIDFEKPYASLEKFGALAGAVENIFAIMIENMIKSNDELSKRQKTTLMVLFTLQKAAAISEIAMNTAVAITKALTLGPIAGPIAAGTIGVLGAVQAGIVAAQKPPFHMGGIIPKADQMAVPVTALPGEAILNREATAGIGEEGINALNAGQGLDRPVVIEMVYKHRIFDNFIQDNIQKGGPLRSALNAGRKVGHR